MDTAQPLAAETDTNAQIANAAKAFLAVDNPYAVQPRDNQGRFAGEAQEPKEDGEEQTEEAEASQNEDEALEVDEGDEDSDYEADDAEEPAQPLPPSWPEDMAETWKTLPAETQSYLAQRDAEQTRALNAKFQEIANARKAAEAEARSEAQAKRDALAQELERVEYAFRQLAGVEPDPRAFGYGTTQFNQAAYTAAYQQWQEGSQTVAQLEQQRKSVIEEKAKEAEQEFAQWKQGIESEWAPKLLQHVPELSDPAKGAPAIHALIDYAKANGIPEDTFAEANQANITSPELLMIWKAMQYDKARTGKAKAKPAPSPVVKPGVSSPRSAQKTVAAQKRRDHLAKTGSIEAGAAIFRELF
jgi:hypothetical protein